MIAQEKTLSALPLHLGMPAQSLADAVKTFTDDLIVPSDDPLTVAEDKLADMTSKMTMVGGKIVHETPDWSG